MSKNFLITTLAVLSLTVVFSANVAFAADYVELAPIPGTGVEGDFKYNSTTKIWDACHPAPTDPACIHTYKVSVGGTTNTLGTYINNLYKIAVAAASVLAVLMLIFGGFTYASTDAIGNKEEGKETIKHALGGLLLVLASWVILNTINPQLVSLKITSTPLQKRGLEDLLMLNQQARDSYNAFIEQADATLTASHANAIKLRQSAADLQNGLNSYKDMQDLKALEQKKLVGGLSEEEVTRLQVLQDQYGNYDEETANILAGNLGIIKLDNPQQEINKLQKSIDSEIAKANIQDSAASTKLLIENTSKVALEAAKAGNPNAPNQDSFRLQDSEYKKDVDILMNEMKQKYKDITDAESNNTISTTDGTNLLNDLKKSFDKSMGEICLYRYGQNTGAGQYDAPMGGGSNQQGYYDCLSQRLIDNVKKHK